MKNIYFPIEIYNRDFHAKSVLAYYLSKENFNVYIGRKAEIHTLILQNEPGIYFGVVTVENYANFYKKLKSLGHKIIILDEEGLVTFEKKMYLDLKVSDKTLDQIDHLFTWGEENKKILTNSKYRKFKEKIFTTGNPRIDLLKTKYNQIFFNTQKQIKEKYKKFVLINTSFSFSDHFTKNLNYVEELKKQKVIKNKNDEKRFLKYRDISSKTKEMFIETVEELSNKYKNLNFVIRPHPSENHDRYINLQKKYKNIFVDYRFSIQPWILSSLFVVHSYCTTAAESLVINRKTFCLISDKDLNVHKNLSFIFNDASYSKNKILDRIEQFLKKKTKTKQNINVYDYYIKNISNKNNSFITLSKFLKNVKVKQFKSSLKKSNNSGYKNIIKKTLSFLSQKNREIRSYVNHKVNNISKKDIKEIFEILDKSQSKKINFNQINRYVVKIEKS